jgi:hypothetical protein
MDDLKPMEACKHYKTVARPKRTVSSIDRADSKGDVSRIARFFASRSSRGGFAMGFSSLGS